MQSFDVFNGDADGICALHQLRLHDPRPEATLITGVKRDIKLLAQIDEIKDAEITVLDVSLDSNREPLERLLTAGNRVFYADHHFSGELPACDSLKAHIDPAATTCTSLIIDALIGGRFGAWAVAGAFGDNLDEAASLRAQPLGLSTKELAQVQEVGQLLNYNGYGYSLEDLHIPPADLYREVHQFEDPLAFSQHSPICQQLREGYAQDMQQATDLTPIRSFAAGRVFHLPSAAWSRRVAGVFSNGLARQEPGMAHATLITNPDGTIMVSVRAPLQQRTGADALCRQFPTGGGRAAAAGINKLPSEELEPFLSRFSEHFSAILNS